MSGPITGGSLAEIHEKLAARHVAQHGRYLGLPPCPTGPTALEQRTWEPREVGRFQCLRCGAKVVLAEPR